MAKDSSAPQEIALTRIGDILELPDYGDFAIRFEERHRELIETMIVRQAEIDGKVKGGFTINFSYELNRKGELSVSASMEFKHPKEPGAKAVAWHTEDGYLTPNNPNQKKFDFRDAKTRERKTKDVTE